MEDQLEHMLGTYAQRSGGIEPLLDGIFRFFERRTDLFHVMTHKEEMMGFQDGVAEEIVMGMFKKYQKIYAQRTGNKIPEGANPQLEVMRAKAKALENMAAKVKKGDGINPTSSGPRVLDLKPAAVETKKPGEKSGDSGSSKDTKSKKVNSSESCSGHHGTTSVSSSSIDSADGGNISKLDPNVREKMEKSSTWNGSTVHDAPSCPVIDTADGSKKRGAFYRWTQTQEELTLEVEITPEVFWDKGANSNAKANSNAVAHCHPTSLKPKDLEINIKRTGLTIRRKGGAKDAFVMKGDWEQPVEPNESIWTVEGGNMVSFSLEKKKATWWKCVFLGDDEIDGTKIESTKRIDDYDGSTQGTIRKIVFDQNQKHKNEPTSDQLLAADLMKDAWNADNSPFKGTPFDPSVLNLSNPLPPDFMDKMNKQKAEKLEEIQQKQREKEDQERKEKVLAASSSEKPVADEGLQGS